MAQMLMLNICLGGQVYIMPCHKNMSMVQILAHRDTNWGVLSMEHHCVMSYLMENKKYLKFELLISFGANVCSLTPTETLSFILMMKSYILLKFFYCLLLGTNVNHHLKLPYQIRKLVQWNQWCFMRRPWTNSKGHLTPLHCSFEKSNLKLFWMFCKVASLRLTKKRKETLQWNYH